jgi:hypothetical protein
MPPQWRSALGVTMALWVLIAPANATAGDEALPTGSDTASTRFQRLKKWAPGHVAIRLTQGGLDEERDPDQGALGGGLLALDVRLGETSLWLSLASEYYKKQAGAVEPWEIDTMGSLYLLYRPGTGSGARLQPSAGVGAGVLTTGSGHKGLVTTVAVGANIRILRRLGFSVEGRYLHSRKMEAGQRIIDFSSPGLLVGFIYTAAWR